MRTYCTGDVDLVLEWADKYVEISSLLKNVLTGQNSGGYPPPLPSIEDEIEFQRLKYWFRQHHDDFVPIWSDFCLSKGKSFESFNKSDEMEFRKNPFLYFYCPDNLLDLACAVGVTTATNGWDPDIQTVELTVKLLDSFNYTVIHLVHWIGEFADTTPQLPGL
jgi:hypothetical protein